MNTETKIDNVLQTGARFAELSDSAKSMVEILAARFCAGVLAPRDGCDALEYSAGSERDIMRLHRILSRDAIAESFEHTGGGVFNSWTVHNDCPSATQVFVCAFGESMTAYMFPDDYFDDACDIQKIADVIYELGGEDKHLQIANVYPHECGDAGKVYAAAGHLEIAATLLDEECARKFPGEYFTIGEQRDALRDGSESFAMLDDMEARMGMDVTQARTHVIDAHLLLGECDAENARTIHEVCLSHEYCRTMSDYGLSEFSSADEMTHGMRGLESECSDYCAEFIARWDSEVSGIAAPYIPGTIDSARESDTSEEEEELKDELAELEEAIEILHASQRDAFARLNGAMSDVRARLRELRTGDKA